MNATLHAAHCYQDGLLTCGWPDQHARSCLTVDCTQRPEPDWLRCRDCSSRFIERALGVTAPVANTEGIREYARRLTGHTAAERVGA
jgi:hypothetical protein